MKFICKIAIKLTTKITSISTVIHIYYNSISINGTLCYIWCDITDAVYNILNNIHSSLKCTILLSGRLKFTTLLLNQIAITNYKLKLYIYMKMMVLKS